MSGPEGFISIGIKKFYLEPNVLQDALQGCFFIQSLAVDFLGATVKFFDFIKQSDIAGENFSTGIFVQGNEHTPVCPFNDTPGQMTFCSHVGGKKVENQESVRIQGAV